MAADRFAELARQAEQARTSNHLTEALHLYREGVLLQPAWSEGWRALGSIYFDQDRFPEAQAAFSRYVETRKDAGPAYALLALCEYETGSYDNAARHLRAWAEKGSPGSPQLVDEATVRWAELLTNQGHFFEAFSLLDKQAVKRGPEPELVEAMGLAWMQMTSLPENYPPERRELVWLAGSAGAWLSIEKYDRAAEFLDRLKAHYNQEPNVHFLRGFFFETRKRDADAREEYRQELKLSPHHTVAMAKLAVLDVQSGELDEARKIAADAVALEPGNAQTHYALGRVRLADERWADAVQELEIARKLAPNGDIVPLYLATAYRKLGRLDDAARETAALKALKSKQNRTSAAEKTSSGSAAPGRAK